VRDRTSSFARIRVTCTLAVFSAMKSAAPTSRFVAPRATRRRTWTSSAAPPARTLGGPEVDAVAAQDADALPPTLALRASSETAAPADARLTRDEHEQRPSLRRLGQRGLELGRLGSRPTIRAAVMRALTGPVSRPWTLPATGATPGESQVARRA